MSTVMGMLSYGRTGHYNLAIPNPTSLTCQSLRFPGGFQKPEGVEELDIDLAARAPESEAHLSEVWRKALGLGLRVSDSGFRSGGLRGSVSGGFQHPQLGA